MDAAEIKAQGNEEYRKGNYKKAVELYTALIETLKSSDAVDKEQLSIAYRNRSAANVALYRFVPGLHDAIMSYNTFPTNNWEACLRAALCSLRTADLAAADKWVERAKQHAPTPTDPAASKSIQEMEESIAHKRQFMSGGRFATFTLSEVLDRLENNICSNYEILDDVPYLIYRIRTILRAHYSKISPDCDAFDVGAEDVGPDLQWEAMHDAWRHMASGDVNIRNIPDLCMRIDYLAMLLAFHKRTFQPNIPRLERLLKVPGCEDIFLSDLPDTTPQQATLYLRQHEWETSFVLGEAEGPKPEPLDPEEEKAAKLDKAADIMAYLTLRVQEGLTAVRGGVVAQRAYQQMALLHSKRLYRNVCLNSLTHVVRKGLQIPQKDREFAKGLALNGGLPGLCYDLYAAVWPDGVEFNESLVHNPLKYLTVDDYRSLPVEEVAEGIDWLSSKLRLYLPDSDCQRCIQDCTKDAVIRIAKVFVHMYRAHGARPFLLAARFSPCINFYVSRMWHFSCGSDTSWMDCMTAEAALDPGDVHAWIDLFTKWGSKHVSKELSYLLRCAVPSFAPVIVHSSQENNLCDNAACDGSRAVFGDDGLRVLKVCGNCQRVAYCSKECQTEDWPRHKKECARLKGGGARGWCYCQVNRQTGQFV